VSSELVGVLAGCAVVFVAGLVDDVRGLRPWAKLGAQLCAVAIVLSSGVGVTAVNNPVLATIIGVLWLVGMTNAVNLLDHMDGVAATVTAIAAGFFALDAATAHPNRLVLVLSLAMAFACLAFLPFNIRPGRAAAVFMGDSGSQVLGFALGSLALLSSWRAAGPSLATVLLPVLVLAVPILDTMLVTSFRLLEGRPVYEGGRDHTSHRLVYSGLSEKHAVILLAVLAAAVGGTALLYDAVDDVEVTLIGVLVTFALLVQFAGTLVGLEGEPGASRRSLRHAFTNQRARALEVLGDFVLITGSFAAAYVLRFDGLGTHESRTLFAKALPVVLASRYALFLLLGLYASIWRYVGARDAVRIAAAVMLSEGVAVALIAISDQTAFSTFSRSVFAIDAVLCTLVIGASRFGARAAARAIPLLRRPSPRRRTLVVGAGRGGRSLIRELHESPDEKVVGLVDDNARLVRRRILGVPVVGTTAELPAILARLRPDAVAVTIPDAPRSRLEPVVAECERAGVPCAFVRRETVAPVLANVGAE
jgi:UDP-GlcNAc:undecaprenyl-phosphate/decaprenyl-phosphate GlcNAc-1-phosphate transferase